MRRRDARVAAGLAAFSLESARSVIARLAVASVVTWGGAACEGSFETEHSGVEDGNEALAAGKVAEAIAAYEEAAAELPETPELSYDRGLARSAAAEHDEATQLLLRALETRDRVLRGVVYSALGAAYARWAMEIERSPGVAPVMPDPALDPAAGGAGPEEDDAAGDPKAAALAKWKRAVEHLEKALVLRPGDPEVLRNLEVALLRVDPPCSSRNDELEPNEAREAAAVIDFEGEATEEPAQSGGDPGAAPAQEGPQDLKKWTRQLTACPDDTDWLKVELEAGDRLSASLNYPAEMGRLGLSLFGPSGAAVASSPVPGVDAAKLVAQEVLGEGAAQVVSTAASRAGTYYLKVANIDGDEVSYGLEVAVRPDCRSVEDHLEENDSRARARMVTPGPIAGLKLCPADPDWYAVTLAAGESLFVYASLSKDEEEEEDEPGAGAGDAKGGGELPLKLEISDRFGQVLTAGGPTGQARIVTLLTPGEGTYLVHVWGVDDLEARYDIDFRVVPPCPEGDDEFEDNDLAEDSVDLAQAQQQQAQQAAPGQGAGRGQQGGAPQGGAPQGPPPPLFARICPGDEDWFHLTAEPDTPSIVTAAFDHPKGDLTLTLYDAEGREVITEADASSDEANGESVALPAVEETTQYKVRVAGKSGSENFYLLKLDNPSGGGGDGSEDPEESEDDEDKDQDEDQKNDPQQQPEEEKGPRPLEEALDNLDHNPENLEAEQAGRKSPLSNHPPEKDW